jgi:Arc/MetJ-type ribon-helix-helix transcriptional regulator
MTTQIAVRLPDELVAFLDGEVAAGEAPSRAAVVARALERERRRRLAEDDARLLTDAAVGDLDDLASWSASQPIDLP